MPTLAPSPYGVGALVAYDKFTGRVTERYGDYAMVAFAFGGMTITFAVHDKHLRAR